jgi:5-methylcytosine-specific restriction endonuclease McrA
MTGVYNLRSNGKAKVPMRLYRKLELFYEIGRRHCCHCGKKMQFREATLEHLVPDSLRRFNHYDIRNLALACLRCNQARGKVIERILRLQTIWHQRTTTNVKQSTLNRMFKEERTHIRLLGDLFIVPDWLPSAKGL